MTADQLAKELGVPRRTLFWMRKRYQGAPDNFNDVEKWRIFIGSNKTQVLPDEPTVSDADSQIANNISYSEARARKTHYGAELLQIQLAATKKNVVPKEDVIALFANTAAVARGRLMKIVNDLPCALVGLDAAAIDRVVREKMEYALSALDIRKDFFEPDSLVK